MSICKNKAVQYFEVPGGLFTDWKLAKLQRKAQAQFLMMNHLAHMRTDLVVLLKAAATKVAGTQACDSPDTTLIEALEEVEAAAV